MGKKTHQCMLKTLGGDVDGFQPRLAVFPGGTPLATNARVSVKVGIFEKVGARKETRTHVASVKNVKFIGKRAGRKSGSRYLFFKYDSSVGVATLLNTKEESQKLIAFRPAARSFIKGTRSLQGVNEAQRKRMLIDTFGSEKIQRSRRRQDQSRIQTDAMVGAADLEMALTDLGEKAKRRKIAAEAKKEASLKKQRAGKAENGAATQKKKKW